ncbi:uncharacterized protein LOC115270035 [Aedes albopictus]|uniref:RRM domain-containing protein n=1 Tax=Aedes albopictus TaxID=7160 RepID=A0ABM1ZEE3_AEDAL
MSVIIRLQNLPWSANALDVRNFFKGLSIPDGGVHIVGGEMGDAFIAFSTDEDARQAMMMNGGKIKEVQVTLLLSSRAEMQKVIEEARRTTMSFMQLSAQSAPVIPQQAPVIPKVTAPAVTAAQPQPQPPVISLSGFLAQNLNQQKNQSIYSEIPGLGFLAPSGGMFQPNAPAAGLFSALSAQSYGAAGSPPTTNSAFTQLSEQLKKVGEAEKSAGTDTSSKSVSKKDGGGERSSRRSRSSSRERDRRRSRSRSRDRGSRRRGRDRSRDRRSRSRSRDRRDRRRRSRSRDRRDDRTRDKTREADQKTADKNSKQKSSRFSERSESKTTPAEAIKIPSPKVTPNVLQPTTFTSPWDSPIQKSLLKLANTDLEKPVQQASAIPPLISPSQKTNSEEGCGDRSEGQGQKPLAVVQNPIMSYRMNVLPSVNYGSFQSSKPLSNEQLSKLQELQARRDTKVFQGMNMGGNRQGGHFSDGESNTFAKNNNRGGFDFPPRGDGNRPGDGYRTDDGMNKRNQSMEERADRSEERDGIDGQSVKISHLENSTGYGEVRRFFHGQTISSNGIKMINDKNGRRTGVALVRFMRRDGKRYALSRDGMRLKHSVIKIESISDQEFEEAIDAYRPSYDEVPNNWKEVDLEEKEKKREEVIQIRDEDEGKQGSVVVWNLPTMTTELDLMRIFSDFTIVEVLIIKNYKNPKQLDGYVKFHRLQDARKACDSTHKHYIRNKRVFVKQCSDIEYDAAKNEYEAPDEPEPAVVVLDDSVQIVNESSKDFKKDEQDDDKMDLAEDDENNEDGRHQHMNANEPTPQKSVENLFGSPPPNMMGMPGNELQQRPGSNASPMNRGFPLAQQFSGMQRNPIEDESWEPERFQQNAPPPMMNRDPRGMFNQNFNNQDYQQEQQQQQQQQQQYQQQPPLLRQHQQQQQAQNVSQLNLGFGGDMSRDPRRRQDDMNQQMHQQMQQPPFGQGPPSSMNNDRFGPRDMGPMGRGNNRFDQQLPPPQQQQQQQPQQMGNMGNNQGRPPFGNDRFDEQQRMGFNQGPPMMGGNRFGQQQMGNNQDQGPMGNNRYQQQQQQQQQQQRQQQQMANAHQGGQFVNNRFNRNNEDNAKTNFIMITNLEFNMQEPRVYDFFDQEGFSPKHVQFIRNRNGRSTGDCLVEFDSPQEAEETLSKHGHVIGKRKAFIKHLFSNQLMDIMQKMNQNGPRHQWGGGPIRGNNFGNSGGNNSFDRENNFGGNNFRNNDNNFRGQDNTGNGGCFGNDDRFMNDNRHNEGRNFQENNYLSFSDDHHYDDDKPEDFEHHEDHDDQEFHDDHEDHNDYSKDVDESIVDENVPEKQIASTMESDKPVENSSQHHDNANDSGSVQHGPEDDDPPLKQPNADYLNPNEDEDQDDEDAEHDETGHHSEPEAHEEQTTPQQPEQPAQQQQQQPQSQQEQQSQQPQSQQSENEDQSQHTDGQDHNDSDMQNVDNQSEEVRGNILFLGNLPFRARNEELAKFFREYNIGVEDVKRRYLPDGRPTGDAMVRFRSGMDAQRAMKTHGNRRMGGRQVRMRVMDD